MWFEGSLGMAFASVGVLLSMFEFFFLFDKPFSRGGGDVWLRPVGGETPYIHRW